MKDEVNEKVVSLAIKTSKLTAEVLQKAMKALLAKKVFSSLTTTTKLPVCQKSAKEKRRNPATLQSLYADKNEGTLFPRPVVVGFLYAFCSSRQDFQILFAHAVEHGIKLTAAGGLFLFPFREKELVY